MAKKRKRRTYGTGSIRQRGAKWTIQFRENGKRRTKSFALREHAERVLKKILGDIAQDKTGLAPDPRSVPPLGELIVPWLERRRVTHRSASDDVSRWKCHLKAPFGNLRPSEVDSAAIRAFVEGRLASISSTTVGHCVRLLSTFFTDLVERGMVPTNPVRSVPRATRRLYRNAHDPKDTGFLERADDIRRVFLALPLPVNVAFAVGALAGLRTSEVIGLTWENVDLDARRIAVRQQVQNGKVTGLKDDESRIVPLGDSLLPVLREHHLLTGGVGPLFRASGRGGRPGRPATFLGPHQLWKHLGTALASCSLPALSWYQATRHTFASQFVLGGGTIERLKMILGHESVTTTERYAHLSPSHFGERELSAIVVNLSPAGAKVLPGSFRAPIGSELAAERPRRGRKKSAKTG